MIDEDAALVTRARDGDREAFAALYERYFDRVYDFLVRTVRDRDEAADVAQDTFLRAMNSLGSLREGASFKSWLFTIARNQALNRLERAGRTRPLGELQGDDEDAPTFDLPDTERLANPADAVEANEMAAIVWEAAAALDARQYSLLDLHVRQGLESAEIAEVLGVTKNNAYVMVNRLKAALEGAVGALVLYRAGRGKCAALDGIIATIETKSLSPDLRKAIDKHATKCVVCQERRTKEMPLAAFAALALVQAPFGAKAAGLEAVMGAWPPAGAFQGAGSGGSNSPAPDGTNGASSGSDVPASLPQGGAEVPAGGANHAANTAPGSSSPGTGPTTGANSAAIDGPAPYTNTLAGPAAGHAGGPSTRSGRTRRRTAVVAGAGAVFLALLLGTFVAFGGNDDADRIIDASKLDPSGSGDGGTFTQAPGVASGGGTAETPGASVSPGAPSATASSIGAVPATPTPVFIANAATGTAVARVSTATSIASATRASGLTSDTPTPPGTQASTAGTPPGQLVPGGNSTATSTATRTSTPTRTPTTASGAPIVPSTATATNTPVPPRIDTPTAIPPVIDTPTVASPVIDTPTPVTPVIDTPTPVTPTVAPPPPPPPVICQPSLAIAPNSITIVGRGNSGTFTVTNTSVNCTASLPVSASPGVSWLSVTPGSVVIPPGGTITFVATTGSTAPSSAAETRVTITGGLLSYQVDVKYHPGLVIAPTRTPTPICSTPNC